MAAYTVFMRMLAAFAIMSSMTGAASLSLDDNADHAINASTAVAFTVSLEADAIGSVPNGSRTSATGTTVSLDTDSSLKPSLSVDATNPAACDFHSIWS